MKKMTMRQDGLDLLRFDECCPVCGDGDWVSDDPDGCGTAAMIGYLECAKCGSRFRYFSAPIQVELLDDNDEPIQEQYYSADNRIIKQEGE